MKPELRRKIFIGSAILGGLMIASAIARSTRKYSFKGKKVLITGGSRGLGLNLARQLVKKGAEVALVARNHDALENAKYEMEEYSDFPVQIYACDLRDRNQLTAMTDFFLQKWGYVDVLINNAGIMQAGPESTVSIQDYEDALNTHFWAPLLITRAFLPSMKERKQGRIINISSIGGKISIPHMSAYSASKFALTGWSEGLYAELRRYNIFVTTVCPGLIRTGSYRNALIKGDNEKEFAFFSILSNAPVTSMSVECAARKILKGSQYGCAVINLSLQTKLATTLHGVSPSQTAFYMAEVNKILPKWEGAETPSRKGHESESKISSSFLNVLGQIAAEKHNQLI